MNLQNITRAVTDVFDFSRWESEEPARPEICDLQLTGEEIRHMLDMNTYGMSEQLKQSFPHLTKNNGKLTSLLKTSFTFEHLGRDCTYEALAAINSCTPSTAYQHALKLQQVYSAAFGIRLHLSSTAITMVREEQAQLSTRRLVTNVMKLKKQADRAAMEALSVERITGQALLSASEQKLLSAITDPTLMDEVDNA